MTVPRTRAVAAAATVLVGLALPASPLLAGAANAAATASTTTSAPTPASASASAAGCSGAGCDHRDPHATGCDADAVTLAGADTAFGRAEIRYSPTCQAAWASVVDLHVPDAGNANVVISNNTTGVYDGASLPSRPGRGDTPMLSAPGGSCLDGEFQLPGGLPPTPAADGPARPRAPVVFAELRAVAPCPVVAPPSRPRRAGAAGAPPVRNARR